GQAGEPEVHRSRSPRPRPALPARLVEAAARARVGARDRLRARARGDCRLVRGAPRLVGTAERPRARRRNGLALVPAVLGARERVLRLAALRLEALCLLEIRKRRIAAPELQQRVAEVVVRVGLVRVADAAQLGDRLLKERQRTHIVPGLHLAVARLVQSEAAERRGPRRRRWWCRRRRRRRHGDRLLNRASLT